MIDDQIKIKIKIKITAFHFRQSRDAPLIPIEAPKRDPAMKWDKEDSSSC